MSPLNAFDEPINPLPPAYFWCTHHRLVHRDDGSAFADRGVHRVRTLSGCTMVGPYATHDEAVDFGVTVTEDTDG